MKRLLIIFGLILLGTQALWAIVTVDGFCFLENTTNYSGTKVLFNAISPSAITDSTYTNADGSYLMGLSLGIYTVHYSHEGWQPYTIGEIAFFEDTTRNDVTLSYGVIEEVSGPQNGIWTTDYIYHVVGDISVGYGQTLRIKPGVRVEFMGYYIFNIYGQLIAAGTENDTILFTSGQTSCDPGDWNRIKFENSSADNSVISYTKIEYANYGIYCDSSSPSISNNTIINNNFHGIYCDHSSSPTISNNTISNNNSGIYFRDSSSPSISNNTISNNDYGIRLIDSSPSILNNIIYDNGTGILANSSPSSLEYNLFYLNNTAGSGYYLPYFGQIITVNANGDSCDTYCNLFMDPLFVEPDSLNFHLTEKSPCRDAGDPSSPPDPDGSIADMGAFYFEQGLNLEPTELDFGNVFIGNDSTLFVTLNNYSDYVITIYDVLCSDTVFTTNWNGEDIPGNDSLIIDVTFTPNTTGTKTGTLTIENSYSDRTVSLSGNGLGAYILPDLYSHNFGAIEPGYPDTLNVEISNTGNIDLNIQNIIDAPLNYFNFVSITDSTISPDSSSILQIEFDPQVEGLFNDTLFIVSNAYNEGSLAINLSGEGGLTPAPVENLIINMDSVNAYLSWDEVTTTIHGNYLVVDCYLVYNCSSPDSVYYFLGMNTDINYTHQNVAYFSDNMFYQVTAYVGDMPTLLKILADYPDIKLGELDRLVKSKKEF